VSYLHFASDLVGGGPACYTGRVAAALRGGRARRSRCPVACTLDIVGDRWTLLVVRDLVRGKRRFADFLESSERIPTNILANRLKRLQGAGIVAAHLYNDRPPRMEYALTPKGEDLRPLVREMVAWGVRHAGGRMPPPVSKE
jgi:DNA-binding HxlR family transcriptional regulator